MLRRISNWSEFLEALDDFNGIVSDHWDSDGSPELPSRLSTIGLQLADWISKRTPHDPARMLDLMRAIEATARLGHMRAFHVSVEERDRLMWRWWPIKELLIADAIEAGAGIDDPISRKPRWDGESGKLLSGNIVVREVPRRATSVRPVLDAFQSAGWPARIVDPLKKKWKDAERVHRICKTLNNGLSRIEFGAGGDGESFIWREREVA
jgi:hypothetical protein